MHPGWLVTWAILKPQILIDSEKNIKPYVNIKQLKGVISHENRKQLKTAAAV